MVESTTRVDALEKGRIRGISQMRTVLGLDRVSFNPAVMGGRACIRGLRITVAIVVNLVANGMTIPAIIREYPDLEPEDIEQALRYAAFLADEKLLPLAEGSA